MPGCNRKPRTSSFSALLFVLVSGVLLAGACRRGDGGQGVVGMFGRTGLGWGDFSYPRAITATPENKIVVADKSGRIQIFSEAGEYEVGWWMPLKKAGKPVGLTVHPDGRLLIADTHYSRVAIYDQAGNSLGFFGEAGTGPGQFGLVTDVEVDAQGYVYVSEYGGNDRITKFSPDLQVIRVFGDQPIEGLRLSRPSGVAIDKDQTLWVADACNHRIVGFSLDGDVLKVFGEMGTETGQMRWPYDVNVCRDGTLLVSEFGNSRLQWFSPEGKSLRTWGKPGREPGELYSPWGAVEAPNGKIYVLDSLNNRVQIVKP